MTKQTVTTLYYGSGFPVKSDYTHPEIAPTLYGQVFMTPFQVRSEVGVSEGFSVNHFGIYVSQGLNGLDLVVVTNCDRDSKDNISTSWRSARLGNKLVSNVNLWRFGVKISDHPYELQARMQIVSSEPKPSDYQLMQMCGLLPK